MISYEEGCHGSGMSTPKGHSVVLTQSLLVCVSLCAYIIKVVKNTKIDSGPHIQSGVVHVSL